MKKKGRKGNKEKMGSKKVKKCKIGKVRLKKITQQEPKNDTSIREIISFSAEGGISFQNKI